MRKFFCYAPALLFAVAPVYCGCNAPTLEKAFAHADAVFVGKAIYVKPVAKPLGRTGQRIITVFSLTQTFKSSWGEDKEDGEELQGLVVIRSAYNHTGLEFIQGQQYLVFGQIQAAERWLPKDGGEILGIKACSGTELASGSRADGDIEKLRAFVKATPTHSKN